MKRTFTLTALTILVGAVLAALATLVAAQPEIDVTKIEYTNTRMVKGKDVNPIAVATGAYLLARDGRQRIDKHNAETGEDTADIIDYKINRHLHLKLNKREVVIGNNTGSFYVPGEPRPGTAPAGNLDATTTRTNLGKKTVAGLELSGTMFTYTYAGDGQLFQHTMELWDYRAPDPRIVPVILEQRFEGQYEIVEQRINAASNTRVPSSAFDIPRGWATTKIP